jgi:superfamily II RNA helicase
MSDEIVNPPQTGARAQSATQGTATTAAQSAGFEGTHKQASDINTEEVLSILQGIVAERSSYDSGRKSSYDLSVQQGDEDHRRVLQNLATQALQNSIETANMVSKQAVRHSDIAIDRQWNVDEQGYQTEAILRSDTFKEAIAAAVAAAVAKTLNPQ